MRGAAGQCPKANNPRRGKLGKTIKQLRSIHHLAIGNAYHFIVQASDISVILFGRLDNDGGDSLAYAGKRFV